MGRQQQEHSCRRTESVRERISQTAVAGGLGAPRVRHSSIALNWKHIKAKRTVRREAGAMQVASAQARGKGSRDDGIDEAALPLL